MNKRRITALVLGLSVALMTAGCSKSSVVETTKTTPEDTTQTETITEPTTAPTTETTVESTTGSEAETETEATAEARINSIEECDFFEVTSEDQSDGVWADVISNTSVGQNVSPQLSWEPVEGAGQYVILMVDPDGGNWLHWRSYGITETELPQGWAPSSEYVGPYPPAGSTHTYDIYVIALRAPVDKPKGLLNSRNPAYMKNMVELDIDVDGNNGNIIAYGCIAGTFTGV